MSKEIKACSVCPWSFLWMNTEAYYKFYEIPICVLSEKEAQGAVIKISANVKRLEGMGIIVRKHV